MGDVYTNPPQSRNEAILNSIVEGTEYTAPPQSRIEDLLLEVKEVIEEGGHDESATRASIAPTESDAAHASKRIEIGEQFYLSDDKLYIATKVIAQGTAIVTTGTGQNCEVSDSVTGQIAEQEQLLEDTVGWVSDDKAHLYEWTGNASSVDFTYTTEYVELNGTASSTTSRPSSSDVPANGKYTLPKGTYKIIYDSTNLKWEAVALNPTEVLRDTFTITEDREIFLRVNFQSGAVFDHQKSYVKLQKISVDDALATKTDTTVIGTVEDGATASQAYAVNDLFIRNGKIGKATANISQGGTFTLNTNYVETTLGEILTGLLNA